MKLAFGCMFLMLLLNASGFFIAEISQEIMKNIISIIYGRFTELAGKCNSSVEANKVGFLLYSRDNPERPTRLNETTFRLINPNVITKILIHGWVGSAFAPNIVGIRRAYLKKSKYNVIAVDWSSYAVVNYATAHCNLPKVGRIVGNIIHELDADGFLRLDRTHLVGHSMGAHVAAYAGKIIIAKTDGKRRIGRLTGLDPAGPLYVGLPENKRLNKDDAEFVDVIHTNAGVFGYPGRVGDVDFYPNCGIGQRGCGNYDLTDNVTLINEIMNEITCDHDRSNQYFIESINSDKFLGKKCVWCGFFCWFLGRREMGDGCSNETRGVYYLKTNSKAPFAKG